MLTIKYEATFKKDFKRVVKRGYNIKHVNNSVTILTKRRIYYERERLRKEYY